MLQQCGKLPARPLAHSAAVSVIARFFPPERQCRTYTSTTKTSYPRRLHITPIAPKNNQPSAKPPTPTPTPSDQKAAIPNLHARTLHTIVQYNPHLSTPTTNRTDIGNPSFNPPSHADSSSFPRTSMSTTKTTSTARSTDGSVPGARKSDGWMDGRSSLLAG